MDKTPFFQNTFLKWEKILDKLPHRSYFKSDKDEKNQNNLNNDKNEAGSSGKNVNQVKQSKAKANDRQSGDGIDEDLAEVKADTLQFNKYQEVDDLINGAIENIQEAAAALANLAGSHEHELKMIIMNILVKFHDWIDSIQKKLNLTKKALHDLRWILATKDIELKVKNREVNELRQSITEYKQKLKTREELTKPSNEVLNSLDLALHGPVTVKPDLLEPDPEFLTATPSQNLLTAAITRVTTISLSSSLKISSDQISSPEFVTAEQSFIFSVANATNAVPIKSKSSEHEVEVNNIAIGLPITSNKKSNNVNPQNKDLIVQPQKLRSLQQKVPVALANVSASQTIVSDVSSGSVDRQTILVDMSSTEVGKTSVKLRPTTYRYQVYDRNADVEKLVEPQQSPPRASISTQISRPLSRIPEQQSSLTLTDSNKDNREIRSPEAVRTFDQSTNLPDISALRMSILRASVNNGNQTSSQSIRDSGTSIIYEQRLSSQTNLQIPLKEKPVIIDINQPKSSNNFEMFRQSINYGKEGYKDERDQRETELKEQLLEIRRENEKLKKDKLKYENTVKKALFHGFMSLIKEEKLNVPKKRITKITYTPCAAPCSTISSSTRFKPNVPNFKVTESLSSQESKRTQSKKYVNAHHPSLSKQSSQNTFCFLKQKNTGPSVKIPELYIQAESIGSGVKTICQGGNCSRAAFYNRNLIKNNNINKAQCFGKTSKVSSHMHKNSATGFNISPTGLQEYTRVMGCKNVLTTLQHRIN